MKKKIVVLVVAAVIVLAGAIAGGYAFFHKSQPSNTPAKTTTARKPVKQDSHNGGINTGTGSVSNAVVVTHSFEGLGQFLTDPKGLALYTYDLDKTGASNCTGDCLKNYPIYQDTGSATDLPANVSTLTRPDNGQIQYTYKGMPLYYYSGDSKTGETTVNGLDDSHHIARP